VTNLNFGLCPIGGGGIWANCCSEARYGTRNRTKPSSSILITSTHNDNDTIASEPPLARDRCVGFTVVSLEEGLWRIPMVTIQSLRAAIYVCCSLPVAYRVATKVAIGGNVVIWRRNSPWTSCLATKLICSALQRHECLFLRRALHLGRAVVHALLLGAK
jgi:hypothetical protein